MTRCCWRLSCRQALGSSRSMPSKARAAARPSSCARAVARRSSHGKTAGICSHGHGRPNMATKTFTPHPHPSPFTLTLHPSPSPFILTLTLTLTHGSLGCHQRGPSPADQRAAVPLRRGGHQTWALTHDEALAPLLSVLSPLSPSPSPALCSSPTVRSYVRSPPRVQRPSRRRTRRPPLVTGQTRTCATWPQRSSP